MPDKKVVAAHQMGYVGITYYAQKKLNGINKISYPIIGTKVDQYESLGSIESPFSKLDFISPVSGSVEEVGYNWP